LQAIFKFQTLKKDNLEISVIESNNPYKNLTNITLLLFSLSNLSNLSLYNYRNQKDVDRRNRGESTTEDEDILNNSDFGVKRKRSASVV